VEENGIGTKAGCIALDVPANGEKAYRLFDGNESFAHGVVTLNFSVKRVKNEIWAEPMSETGFQQIIIKDEAVLEASSDKASYTVSEELDEIVISGIDCKYALSKKTGLFTSIVKEGSELLASPSSLTIWRAPTDNERNVKHKYFAEGFDREYTYLRKIRAEENEGIVTVYATMVLSPEFKLPTLGIECKYVFDGNGVSVHMDCVCNADIFIPRFGYVFNLVEGYEDMEYFGYGPYESYVDKCKASRLGIFKTTISDNFENYIRPQENGAHFGTRYVNVTSAWGERISVQSEKPFSFNASHYTPKMLTDTAHHYELSPMKETQLIIDYKQSGVGSNSCGPDLMENYRFDEKEFSFHFNFRFERK
jgi:beta-galactosidase